MAFAHSSSSRPHLALVICVTLVFVFLSFLLVAGWRWHLGLAERKDMLEKQGQATREAAAGHAPPPAPRISSSPSPSSGDTALTPLTPGPVPAPMPAEATPAPAPGVSLNELARTGADPLFSEPEPLTTPVSEARLKAAQLTLERFLQATVWEEKLLFVADPERVRPAMRDHYEIQRKTDPDTTSARQEAAFRINNTEVLLFTHGSTRPGSTADMALIARDGGEFKVDWESFVGASELAWPEFKKQRPETPKLFRVFAQPDDYFNYEFTDSGKYLCMNLTSPDGLYFIYGYCEKDSDLARTLGALQASGPARKALTLRLAFPPKAESDHCVRITGVVANRWLIVP